MRKLSTHVLDTAHGCPADGMRVRLYRLAGDEAQCLVETRTNADGRTDTPLLVGPALSAGVYELQFEAGEYFRRRGLVLGAPPFVDVVLLRFGVEEGEEGYHVPLLVSPFSWSSYRGS